MRKKINLVGTFSSAIYWLFCGRERDYRRFIAKPTVNSVAGNLIISFAKWLRVATSRGIMLLFQFSFIGSKIMTFVLHIWRLHFSRDVNLPDTPPQHLQLLWDYLLLFIVQLYWLAYNYCGNLLRSFFSFRKLKMKTKTEQKCFE